jgi:hypothetical protein
MLRILQLRNSVLDISSAKRTLPSFCENKECFVQISQYFFGSTRRKVLSRFAGETPCEGISGSDVAHGWIDTKP